MSRDSSAAMFQIKGPIRFAILPLFDQYWTTAKYRSVIRSEALAQFGIQQARFRGDQVMSAASDWLEEKVFLPVAFSISSCLITKVLRNDGWSLVKSSQ